MQQGKFTYDYYRSMIETLMSDRQCILLGDGLNAPDDALIVRHDIDFSLELAMPIAGIENEMGLSSTYYLRLDAAQYNLFSYTNSERVEALLKFGHEIGVHVSFSAGGSVSEADYLAWQLMALEKRFGIRTRSFAPHEPARAGLLDKLPYQERLLSAYQPQLLESFKYLSDSGGRWREGDPMEWLDKRKLYILTHPFWWYRTVPNENY